MVFGRGLDLQWSSTMKKLYVLSFLFLLSTTIHAQQNIKSSNFWIDTEISYGLSLASLSDNYGLCEPGNNSVSSLLVAFGYCLSPSFALGLSSGIESYINPGLNYVPIFMDFKFKPTQSKSLIDAKIGSQIIINEDQFTNGLCAELFYGYTIYRKNSFRLVASAGYKYTGYSVTDFSKITYKGDRNALLFKMTFGFGGR